MVKQAQGSEDSIRESAKSDNWPCTASQSFFIKTSFKEEQPRVAAAEDSLSPTPSAAIMDYIGIHYAFHTRKK